MKKVNFNPELKLKKKRIMEEFSRHNEPDDAAVRENPAADSGDADGNGSEAGLKERIIDALKTVYDPEIPVNIFDLGLIYDIRISADRFVDIDMTLTTPGCPVAHTFPGMVERSVMLVPGVAGAAVELVWEPPWTPDVISEAARLELGLI